MDAKEKNLDKGRTNRDPLKHQKFVAEDASFKL